MSTVLVIAPHPDDEVLGVGGTILKHLSAMMGAPKISTRAAVVYVLGQLRGDSVIKLLSRLAQDDAEEIRIRVVSALENQPGLEPVRILRSMVNDMVIVMTRNRGGKNFNEYPPQFIRAVTDGIAR